MRIENLPKIDVEEEARRAEERVLEMTRPVGSDGTRRMAPVEQTPGALGEEAETAPRHAAQGDVLMPSKRPGKMRSVVAAACVVALLGVGAAYALTSGVLKTEEPEVPAVAPTTAQATVKVDNVLVPGEVLKRGDVLEQVQPADELTGAYADQYYRAQFNGVTVYVEKKLVRTSDEAAPEEWVGYAAENAIIFAKPDLSGDDICTLALNEEVTVLDSFNDLLFVRNVDGYEGYMPADKVLREKAAEPEPEDASVYTYDSSSNYSYSYGYSSGGSGGSWSGSSSGGSGSSGGSSGGGSNSAPSGGGSTGGSTSGDGDEMTLPMSGSFSVGDFLLGTEIAYADELAEDGAPDLIATAEEVQGATATVLMDGTQTYLCILNRGDEVTVKIDDLFGFGEEGSSGSGEADAASDSSDVAPAASDKPLSQEELDLAAASGEGEASADGEDVCTVLINEQEVLLPERILRLADAAAYEPWTGYAAEGAMLFADYKLTSGATELELNQELRVVDEAGSVLVVESDGAFYCIDAASVAKEAFEEPEPEAEEAVESGAAEQGGSYSYYEPQYSYSGGGGGGSSSSGGSSSGGSSDTSGGGSSATAPDTDGGTAGGGEAEIWTPTQK